MHQSLVTNEINKMLEDKLCSICGKEFNHQEKNNVIVSGVHPLTYAHDRCWKK